jgi:hypothetical protein
MLSEDRQTLTTVMNGFEALDLTVESVARCSNLHPQQVERYFSPASLEHRGFIASVERPQPLTVFTRSR